MDLQISQGQKSQQQEDRRCLARGFCRQCANLNLYVTKNLNYIFFKSLLCWNFIIADEPRNARKERVSRKME
jgi:hypothetical protein